MDNRPGSLSSWFRLGSQTRRAPPPPTQQPQAALDVQPRRGVPVRQTSIFARFQEDAVQTQQQPVGPITRNPPPPPATAPPPPPPPATAPPPRPRITAVQPQPQPMVPAPKQADQVPQRESTQTIQKGNGGNSPTPPPPRVVVPPSPPTAAVRAPTPAPEPVILIKTIVPATPAKNPTLLVPPHPNDIDLEDSISRDKMKLNSNTQAEAQKVLVPNPHADTRNISPSSPKKEFKRAGSTLINGKKDEDMARVITMSGHNEGAIMNLSAARRHLHKLHGAKDSGSESDEKESKEEGEKKNWFLAAGKKKTPVVTLTNSNVQCVNNSILFNASAVQRDPGVHINFARRQRKNSAAVATSGSVIQSAKSSNTSPTK